MPSHVGLPVNRPALSAASALGATRAGEHFVGRGGVSDGQRPILILAASCDCVKRCRNLVCLLSCPGGDER